MFFFGGCSQKITTILRGQDEVLGKGCLSLDAAFKVPIVQRSGCLAGVEFIEHVVCLKMRYCNYIAIPSMGQTACLPTLMG